MKPNNYLADNNIIPFRQPAWHPSGSGPAPQVLEALITEAQDAAHFAFHDCIQQIESIKAAVQLQRDGDMGSALEVFSAAKLEAAGVVEGFLESLVHLQRLRTAVMQWLDVHTGKLPAAGRDVLEAAGAVVVWTGEEPAAALLEACRLIADRVSAVSHPFPELTGMEDINLAAFDGSDARVRAGVHGVDIQFLRHAAHLLHLPWLTRAA